MTTDRLQKLKPRELEVLALIAEGYTNYHIARKLFLSHGTVNHHIVNISQKLEVTGSRRKARHTRVTMALMYFRRSEDIVATFPSPDDLQQWEHDDDSN